MNKRQREKASKFMKKDIIYLKLYINENDRYNPEIKCRGFSEFFRKAMYLGKKYNCNIGYYNQSESERTKLYDCEEDEEKEEGED